MSTETFLLAFGFAAALWLLIDSRGKQASLPRIASIGLVACLTAAGFGRIAVTPSRPPSARSASERSRWSCPSILSGGSGGRGAGWKARYPLGCRVKRPDLMSRTSADLNNEGGEAPLLKDEPSFFNSAAREGAQIKGRSASLRAGDA